jgi:hypothetical protein
VPVVLQVLLLVAAVDQQRTQVQVPLVVTEVMVEQGPVT